MRVEWAEVWLEKGRVEKRRQKGLSRDCGDQAYR